MTSGQPQQGGVLHDKPSGGHDAELVEKLLGSPSAKIRVVLASLAILVTGALVAPRPAPDALPVSEERPTPLLQEEVQRRQPVPTTVLTVTEIVANARPYGVTIPPPPAVLPRTSRDDGSRPLDTSVLPSGLGVVVSAAGDVLTHAGALAGRSTLQVQTPTGTLVDATLAAYEPATGLVLLRAPRAAREAPPMREPTIETGALVVAAAPWQGREIGVPAFITSATRDVYTFGEAAGPIPPGAPLYDLGGQLVAIAAGSSSEPAVPHHGGPAAHQPRIAFPARAAIDRLFARVAEGRGRPATLGIQLQAIEGPLEQFFGDTGVLVTEAVDGGPAANAGIAPGDVLVAVGDTIVDSVAAAQHALGSLTPGGTVTLHVVRGGAERQIDVAAAPTFHVDAMRVPRPVSPATPEARSVLSDAQLAAMRIPPGALVLQVNGRTVNSRAQALRELERSTASVLYLLHDGQAFFAAVRAS